MLPNRSISNQQPGTNKRHNKRYRNALAERFAQKQINLILVSRNIDSLNQQEETLSIQYGIKVYIIVFASEKTGVSLMIYEQVKQLGFEVQYLVNNVGFNECDSFL